MQYNTVGRERKGSVTAVHGVSNWFSSLRRTPKKGKAVQRSTFTSRSEWDLTSNHFSGSKLVRTNTSNIFSNFNLNITNVLIKTQFNAYSDSDPNQRSYTKKENNFRFKLLRIRLVMVSAYL